MNRTKRIARMKNNILERKALRVSQKGGHHIFLTSLRGTELLQLAGVSRVSRDDDGRLIGYQRPEVRRHVREIADYLQEPDMLLAHPVILSFTSAVKFVSSRGQKTSDGLAETGWLRIPLPREKEEKPAWIVDGQQRALAIGLCKDKDFAVPICAFIADQVEIQRDQFLRINNTKPLPRGLVTELLPEVTSPLPAKLAIRKVPSALCDLLNRDEKSPFHGLIRRPSDKGRKLPEGKEPVVADTVIVKMIEESLTQTSGCLFPYRNVATGEYDQHGIWAVLVTYWSAVRGVFSEAWGKPPTESRLMHGVGIRAMGKLMDRIMATVDIGSGDAVKAVRHELSCIAPFCRWTNGEWEQLGGIKWNELQNLHKHHSILTNYLIRLHVQRRDNH